MRLVLLSTNMAAGGAETQVAQIAIELQRRGWDVHVVSLVRPSAWQSELAAAGIPLHGPALPALPLLLHTIRPHVLHCHMFHANIAGRLLRMLLPFPVVISTIHSAAESPRGSGRIGLRDTLYRITDRLADRTTTVSRAAAERHQQARAVRNPLIIPNGINTDRFRPDPAVRQSMRRELQFGDADFVWLAVGRLMWKKNFAAAIQAFRQLGFGTLLLVGSGPQEQELRALAEGTNVRFLGQQTAIADLMNAADAFVLSSVVEGLPLVLLEAAATALPCISTAVGGVPETGIGLISEPGHLASDMGALAAMSPAARRALGEAGRRRVVEHYSLQAVVTQWESLYRTASAHST